MNIERRLLELGLELPEVATPSVPTFQFKSETSHSLQDRRRLSMANEGIWGK